MSVEEMALEGSHHGLHVAIVGIGGAGNNLLSHAISDGLSPKNCVAVNNDRSQLSECQAQNKVLLADSLTMTGERLREGLRTRQALAHRVVPFTSGSDFTILLTGLGGVMGTSTAPLIAQLNRNQVRPVVSVVALPFIHERERRFVALRGLKRMVEACDCTVVVDNGIRMKPIAGSDRAADETAGLAVRSLSEVVAMESPMLSHRILSILALGQVATVCIAPVSSNDGVQSAVVDALRTPSANLPMTKAKGAVMLFRGLEPLSTGQAAHAYDALASLVGHDVEFVQVSTRCAATPSLSVFLSGYSYSMALRALVDLIEDLYDMEYGIESGSAEVGLPVRLYQMEGI